MIDEADLDHDGEINEQEFLRIMKKTSLYWNFFFFLQYFKFSFFFKFLVKLKWHLIVKKKQLKWIPYSFSSSSSYVFK